MMQGKVALEEHVVLPSLSAPGAVGAAARALESDYFADVRRRLADTDARLEDMDRFGVHTTAAVSAAAGGASPISDADRQKIGRNNARRVLGLD